MSTGHRNITNKVFPVHCWPVRSDFNSNQIHPLTAPVFQSVQMLAIQSVVFSFQ